MPFNSSLFSMVHDYFVVYLPEQRNVSPNTIRSYRKTVEELLDYTKEKYHIPLSEVKMEHLTADCILSYLAYLRNERKCSVSTHNTRAAAIRAFLSYVSDRDVTAIHTMAQIKKVPFTKPDTFHAVDYLSTEAISAIVEQTDPETEKGFRDRVLLILMYDTGARVQEILNIRLCDIQFGKVPKVTLLGKGRKKRTVPLMQKTVQYLKQYISRFHADQSKEAEVYLFYSVIHGQTERLTDRRIRYIIEDYGQKARESCPEIPEHIHPHLFRHSRAMHLYQAGMDLTLVSQWLGHSNISTTLVYAHADTEQKRKAIEAATPPNSPLGKNLNPTRFTVTDEELLKKLTGLR
ncbi:MAG: tyrosine-type recombinase/integrase [Acidaminococcaceae bacterium]|nr:tyrosine-type recombinase/integrase [Acidaminococcaceae bacterium]